MGLVDHQVRLSGLVDPDLRYAAKGRARREDVVVIADDEVRLPGTVELQFKGADLVLLPQVAKRAGLQFPLVRQICENSMGRDLRGVIAGILTVFWVAERLVLEADLPLCRDREGFDAAPVS